MKKSYKKWNWGIKTFYLSDMLDRIACTISSFELFDLYRSIRRDVRTLTKSKANSFNVEIFARREWEIIYRAIIESVVGFNETLFEIWEEVVLKRGSCDIPFLEDAYSDTTSTSPS